MEKADSLELFEGPQETIQDIHFVWGAPKSFTVPKSLIAKYGTLEGSETVLCAWF